MQSKRNRLKKKVESVEAAVVSAALERHGWRLASAAEYLGIPRQTLQSIIGRNAKLEQAYKKHGHGRGRPHGARRATQSH